MIAVFIESKVGEHKKIVEKELEEKNKEEISEFKESITDTLDDYLNYFVEQYIEDNAEAISDAVKVKTAERVLEGMHSFVNDFNIKLNENVTIDEDEKEELQSSLNRAINENIELNSRVQEQDKYAVILEYTMEMDVVSNKSNFSKLAEGIEYEEEDTFREKLDLLKKNINNSQDDKDDLFENAETDSAEKSKIIKESKATGKMATYLEVLEKNN